MDGIERRKARVWLPRMVGRNCCYVGCFACWTTDSLGEWTSPVRVAEAKLRERDLVAR